MAEQSEVLDEALPGTHILASDRTMEADLLVGTNKPIKVEATLREVTDVRDRTRRMRREGEFWAKEFLGNIHLLEEGIVLHFSNGESEEIVIINAEVEQSADGQLTHVTFMSRMNIRI